jgi:hypothetical protein
MVQNMKQKFLLLAFTTIAFSFTSTAQDIVASTIKIGQFYLGMKHTEIEKISTKKFTTTELKTLSDDYEKTTDVMVNGVKYTLDFYPTYSNEGKLDGTYTLSRVVCADSKVKTKSGITVGMDKFEVLKKLNSMNISFEFNKYTKYDNDGKPTKFFKEYIKINDTQAGKSLTLNIENDKVQSFELYYEEGC